MPGDGDGELSFSEEGACINESKELLAALGDGVGPAPAFVGGGLDSSGVSSSWMGADFRRGFGVGSTGTGVGFDRGLKMLLSHPLFFGFAGSPAASA